LQKRSKTIDDPHMREPNFFQEFQLDSLGHPRKLLVGFAIFFSFRWVILNNSKEGSN